MASDRPFREDVALTEVVFPPSPEMLPLLRSVQQIARKVAFGGQCPSKECGQKWSHTYNFCPYCGSKLLHVDDTPNPAGSP